MQPQGGILMGAFEPEVGARRSSAMKASMQTEATVSPDQSPKSKNAPRVDLGALLLLGIA
jgi:hypothetical protein